MSEGPSSIALVDILVSAYAGDEAAALKYVDGIVNNCGDEDLRTIYQQAADLLRQRATVVDGPGFDGFLKALSKQDREYVEANTLVRYLCRRAFRAGRADARN